MKFDTITIFHAKTTERKEENHKIHDKEREEDRASLLQLHNNPDNRHKVKLAS